MGFADRPPVFSGSGINVKYGTQIILENAAINIHEGERVGLVGRNGSGKSTFLSIAAGVADADSGSINRRRDQIIGFMPQSFTLDPALTVQEAVRGGAKFVLDMIAEFERLPAESPRATELMDRIAHYDGWTIEARTRMLIESLHAPAAERSVGQLSGGEKRRVALCRALLGRPDFLILDEPTNHLDTGSIEWLEDFLARYAGTCLFVTHDRYFLDRVATRIVELRRAVFASFEGNYTDYMIARAERDSVEAETEHQRQKFLKRELEWVRRRPSARRTKSVDRVRRYFEMAAERPAEQESEVELLMPPPPKLANRVISIKALAVAQGGRELFRGLDLEITAGMRLGIVGRNGLGKTTLLRCILGDHAPAAGEVLIGERTAINYVDQNRMALDDNKTIYDEVGGTSDYVAMGDERITVRSYLRRYLFTDDRINSRIAQLSGGERSRVALAKVLKHGGNVLILDEPTNDLDLGTLRMLEESLVVFPGTVIVVSHDRYFLNRVCTDTLAFEDNGQVAHHVGNYDYYLEKKATPVSAATPTPKPAAKPAVSPAPSSEKPRKLSFKEQRELEGMEQTILEAEAAAAEIEALFAQPDFYAKHAARQEELAAKLDHLRHEVPRLYARWEELTARAEATA